jgi:hypothetical protein
MFIPYSADIVFDRRPWASYFLFLIVVAASFLQFVQTEHLVIFFSWLGSLIFLWTFGKAVCSKIGNIVYIFVLFIIATVPSLVNILADEVVIWVLGCVINGIMGMYLVFWPANVVECFLLIPPWGTFSASGFWIVLAWLVFDMLAVAIFEPTWGYLVHLSNFVFGIVISITLLKLRVVPIDRDDKTLLQIIMHEESPDEAWSESWSVRKAKIVQEEEQDSKGIEESIRKPVPQEANTESIRVLCQCGEIIEAPAGTEGQAKHCPKCSRRVVIPGNTN